MTGTQSGGEADTEGLQRITVNLTPKSQDALQAAMAAERLSKTGVINRALQMYAFVIEAAGRGEDMFLGKPGALQRIRWL